MNAATGQKIGLGGTVTGGPGITGIGGLSVASAAMGTGNAGVTGMGIAGLSDPSKGPGGMLNFNIQASKVISNRPGVVANPGIGGEVGNMGVGVYGSNASLMNNN